VPVPEAFGRSCLLPEQGAPRRGRWRRKRRGRPPRSAFRITAVCTLRRVRGAWAASCLRTDQIVGGKTFSGPCRSMLSWEQMDARMLMDPVQVVTAASPGELLKWAAHVVVGEELGEIEFSRLRYLAHEKGWRAGGHGFFAPRFPKKIHSQSKRATVRIFSHKILGIWPTVPNTGPTLLRILRRRLILFNHFTRKLVVRLGTPEFVPWHRGDCPGACTIITLPCLTMRCTSRPSLRGLARGQRGDGRLDGQRVDTPSRR
jgi:hypothetical protein